MYTLLWILNGVHLIIGGGFNTGYTGFWNHGKKNNAYWKKLNSSKAPAPGNIHGKVLKECSESIACPLNLIFNKSMTEGNLPSQWKVAHVKPLFKKGKRAHSVNYRPVSLTSLCCKLLERIIKVVITKYLVEKLGLITGDQHLPQQDLQALEQWGHVQVGHEVQRQQMRDHENLSLISTHQQYLCVPTQRSPPSGSEQSKISGCQQI